MSLELYNKENLEEGSRRIPQDRISGNGVDKDFALYYLTPEIVARVYLDETLLTENIDFYLYSILGTGFISFYDIPALGTNNIICQAGTCLFFPGGTTEAGQLNGYSGESVDIEYYLSNTDASKGYLDVTITPSDFIGENQANWVKLATTQGGLDSAVAGDPLNIGTINDVNTAHAFWVRLTVPPGSLPANAGNMNKYDITFILSGAEYII